MLTIPIRILMMVIVFLAVVGALYFIFGSPRCDSMANTTAYYLKLAIDEVASDKVPVYMGDGVPDDPIYYRTAPIRLCQENFGTYTYILGLMGGEPEYKIYYESFPGGPFQGGAWTWDESYPWHGGAASLFFSWAMFRGVTIAGKVLWHLSAVKNVIRGMSLVNKLKGAVSRVRGFFSNLLHHADDLEDLGGDVWKATSSVDELVYTIGSKDAGKWVEGIAESGIIKMGDENPLVDEAGRFILNDEDMPAVIYQNVFDEDTGIWDNMGYEVYTKTDAEGFLTDTGIAPVGSPPPAGFEADDLVTFNPAKDLDTIKTEMSKIDSQWSSDFSSYYVTPGEAEGILKEIKEGIESNFGNKIYRSTVGRVKRLLDTLKGYLKQGSPTSFKQTAAVADGMAVAVLEDPESAETFRNTIKWSTKLKNAFLKKFHLTSEDQITLNHIKEVLEELHKRGSVGIYSEESWFSGWKVITDGLIHGKTYEEIADAVKNLPNYEKFLKEYFESPFHGATRFDDIYIGLWDHWDTVKYWDDPEGEMYKFLGEFFTMRVSREIEGGIKNAEREFGIFYSYLTQDASMVPYNFPGIVGVYVARSIKKAVFFDGMVFVSPSSWLSKFLLGRFTEGCMGNSICVYSHGAQMEYPYYLNETADKYDIRLWRPVSTWEKWALWQAAIKHVPSHPRFYVVSPCFAVAKIWKTVYDGKDTIFVLPEKVDLGDAASNYCYADEDLINKYTWIWFGADLATLVEIVITGGTAAGKSAMKTVIGKVWSAADPITLVQVGLEAAISWPTWPWKPLNYQTLVTAAPNVIIPEE